MPSILITLTFSQIRKSINVSSTLWTLKFLARWRYLRNQWLLIGQNWFLPCQMALINKLPKTLFLGSTWISYLPRPFTGRPLPTRYRPRRWRARSRQIQHQANPRAESLNFQILPTSARSWLESGLWSCSLLDTASWIAWWLRRFYRGKLNTARSHWTADPYLSSSSALT